MENLFYRLSEWSITVVARHQPRASRVVVEYRRLVGTHHPMVIGVAIENGASAQNDSRGITLSTRQDASSHRADPLTKALTDRLDANYARC